MKFTNILINEPNFKKGKYITNESKNSKKTFIRLTRNFIDVHHVLNLIKIKNKNF